MKYKTIKTESGNVKITNKTLDVLVKLLNNAEDGFVSGYNLVNGRGTNLDYKFISEIDTSETHLDCGWAKFDYGEAKWTGNIVRTQSSMNSNNDICGREINKLIKMGIIKHFYDGDWDDYGQYSMTEVNISMLEEFADLTSTEDLKNQKQAIIDTFLDEWTVVVKKIESLKIDHGKDEYGDRGDANFRIRRQIEDAMSNRWEELEKQEKEDKAKKDKIAKLKAEIKTLETK